MPLIMSQRHTTHFEESKKICALKIKNAKADDSGVYTVVVENPYGSDDSSGQVFVGGPDDGRLRQPQQPMTPNILSPVQRAPPSHEDIEQNKPPKIVKHLQPESSVTEGEPIILNCMIEGTPLPKVRNT